MRFIDRLTKMRTHTPIDRQTNSHVTDAVYKQTDKHTNKYRLTDRKTNSHITDAVHRQLTKMRTHTPIDLRTNSRITDAVYKQIDKHRDKHRLTDRQTDSHITDAVCAGSERKVDLLGHNFHTCPGHLMRHKLFQSARYHTVYNIPVAARSTPFAVTFLAGLAPGDKTQMEDKL